MPPTLVGCRKRGASLRSGFARIFAKTTSKGASLISEMRLCSIANEKPDARSAILAAILARDFDGDRVKIDSGDRCLMREGLGRRDGEKARPGAEIQHCRRPCQQAKPIQRKQTSPRRAVMSRAEGPARHRSRSPIARRSGFGRGCRES